MFVCLACTCSDAACFVGKLEEVQSLILSIKKAKDREKAVNQLDEV